MSKKRYLVSIDVLSGSIYSCDECLFDKDSDYIQNGRYYVVVSANNPKDAQRDGMNNFKVAKFD